MSDFKPVRFGKYILLDKIAVGGMAELFRGKLKGAKGFEKLIAIKKILPHLAADEALVNSFISEAKLAAYLNHENIVQIYDFGSMEGSYFIAMEYLFGKNLRDIDTMAKEKGSPPHLELTLYIISRVLDGLQYAHSLHDFNGEPLNIIHRDISPPNIFVTYEGQVKIVDFGIAKAAGHDSTTQFGKIKGKVAYMAPEQADGKSIDLRSDIFSTGILLYEMATNQRLYKGESTMEVLSKARNAEFQPADQLTLDLPLNLYEILNKALAKDPADRYQTAGEMLADVDSLMHQMSMRPSARTLSQYMKDLFHEELSYEEHTIREVTRVDLDWATSSGVKRDATSYGEQKGAKSRGRERWIWIGALFLEVLIIGLMLFFIYKDKAVTTASMDENSGQVEEARKPETENPQAMAELKAAQQEMRNDRFIEALARFDRAIALQPSLKETMEEEYIRTVLKAAQEMKTSEPKEAVALLDQGLEIDPSNARLYAEQGLVYLSQKAYEEAARVYKKAIEIDPGMAEPYFNLGYIYARDEEYDLAERMYSKVVELQPPYLDEALFNLGVVQIKQGKKETGKINLKRALKVNPDNKQAKQYLQRLSKS